VLTRSVRGGGLFSLGVRLLVGSAQGAGPAPDRWGGLPGAELEASLLLSAELGRVPAFRVAEADRLGAGVAVQWTPHPITSTWISTRLARTRSPSPVLRTGFEGLELGSRLRPFGSGPAPVEPGLAWWTRVPLSPRIDGVASPAADLTLALELGRRIGAGRLELAGGLQILGNPLLDAEQDDRLSLRATGVAPLGPLDGYLSVHGGLASPRNPAQGEVALGVEGGCLGRLGLEVATGLNASGPDLAVRTWLELARACRSKVGD
jgi:hypothetical protein